MDLYFAWLVLINLTAILLYGADKRKSKKRRRRIPEAILLLTAALGGGIGSFLAMQIFRHKTNHLKFVILVPLFILAYLILTVFLAQKAGMIAF